MLRRRILGLFALGIAAVLTALLATPVAAQEEQEGEPSREEMLKKYDKDGDGRLSEEEMEEARRDMWESRMRGRGPRGARVGMNEPAQEGEEFIWETDLEAALAKAREKGRPLLVSMHVSTEKACERMLSRVYTDPEVRAKLAHFVVLPTCQDAHEEIFMQVKGEERKVSLLFETVDCSTLMKNEEAVRARFLGSETIKVPHHFFVGDDGNRYMARDYELRKGDFLDLLDEALVAYGLRRIGGLSAEIQAYFKQIRTERGKDREAAVKAVLQLNMPEINELLYPTIQSLKKEEDRAQCIRAMGYREFNAAAPVALKWLTDKSTYIKNCAVVTLEEMRAAVAMKLLLELFPLAKDRELKKDILRALGPCGAGDPAAKGLLISEVKSKEEKMRLACYLSLGHFLDDAEVLSLMKERYKKEGRNTLLKIGILWAFQASRNGALAAEVEALLEKEKNHQLETVAEGVIGILGRTRGRVGRGGRGAGGAGGGAGPNREFMRIIRTLYEDDKIIRNEIKDRMEDQRNIRAGGGGRGR